MKTVIYLDILLAVNFIIAFFLLMGTANLCGQPCRFSTVAVGAAVAAAASLLILVPKLAFLAQLGLKIMTGALCTRAAFPAVSLRGWLQVGAWYLLLNLILAGCATGYILQSGAGAMQINNLTVYINLSPPQLIACVAVVYGGLQLVLWCFDRPSSGLGRLSAVLLQQKLNLSAFYDTGLHIKEPLSDAPCVMLSVPRVQAVLPQDLQLYLQQYFRGDMPLPPPVWKLRLICCATAAGDGVFPALPLRELVLETTGKTYRCTAAWAVFCAAEFPHQCMAIYGPDLLQKSSCTTPKNRRVS